MATVSFSCSPISTMTPRRTPLANNPNVANSPLRSNASLGAFAKQKRSHAFLQREEAYGQPPPTKKQAFDAAPQVLARSPPPRTVKNSTVTTTPTPVTTTTRTTQVLPQRSAAPRPPVKERSTRTTQVPGRTAQDVEAQKEVWKKHHRAKFPKMVFYFESISDEVRAKLTRDVTHLGARQEPFFSIDVTHVVTGRPIPPEKPAGERSENVQSGQAPAGPQQPQTINPSLLDRGVLAPRRKLFGFSSQMRMSVFPNNGDAAKRAKGSRSSDVLHKAREMNKKIWSLEKFQNMLSVLLEETDHATAAPQAASVRFQTGATKGSHQSSLLQMLQNERINGPSDRDPTATNRDLVYWKGPYIYVWDMDEKQKPIMVREFRKVLHKADGDWPQFRSVGNGRCPFVEEVIEIPDKEERRNRERDRAGRPAKDEHAGTTLKPPPEIAPPKPVTGKRSLAEMEEGHERVRLTAPTTGGLSLAKTAFSNQAAVMRPSKGLMNRVEGGRLLAGEPIASGIQPSNVTSAIRSQMVSSTSGINGAKAGTSKELHGLQMKVLQRANPVSHDLSSRRLAEVSMDVASSRSTNMSRPTSKNVQTQDDEFQKTDAKEKRSQSQMLKSKRDLKPGYCENCQDKFRDFDEHVVTRKHRRFAENDDNWTELDLLLEQLKRLPKYADSCDETYSTRCCEKPQRSYIQKLPSVYAP